MSHATKVYELGAGRVYRYAGDSCQGVKAAERFHRAEHYPPVPLKLEEITPAASPTPLGDFEPGDLVWVQHVGFVSGAPGAYDNPDEWRLCVVCAQLPEQPEKPQAPTAQQLLALLFRQVQANGKMLHAMTQSPQPEGSRGHAAAE